MSVEVKCCKCGCKNDYLFNKRKENGEHEYTCITCMRKKPEIYDNGNVMVDSYIVKWKLRNPNGHEWIESFDEMSLTDYEILYGNNPYMIVWCNLRLKNQAMI